MTEDPEQKYPTHRKRYEGWKDDRPEEGTVRRFDHYHNRWVKLQLDDVPESVKNERRVG